MSLISRLTAETSDLIELVLIPACSIVLPWRVAFKFYYIICRHFNPYQASSVAALSEAKKKGVVSNDREWIAKRRLVTLIDHADLYLSKTRSNKWMKANLSVEGEWPRADEPAVLLTFHWGAGMWGLRHAASKGLTPSALVAPIVEKNFTGRTLSYNYALVRTGHVKNILRRKTLDVSRDLRSLVSALHGRAQVLAAIDVPCDQAVAAINIKVLNQDARIPKALLRTVVDLKVPVFLYTTGICFASGKRTLHIRNISNYSSLDELSYKISQLLDESLLQESAAWHFWSEFSRFFVRREN